MANLIGRNNAYELGASLAEWIPVSTGNRYVGVAMLVPPHDPIANYSRTSDEILLHMKSVLP